MPTCDQWLHPSKPTSQKTLRRQTKGIWRPNWRLGLVANVANLYLIEAYTVRGPADGGTILTASNLPRSKRQLYAPPTPFSPGSATDALLFPLPLRRSWRRQEASAKSAHAWDDKHRTNWKIGTTREQQPAICARVFPPFHHPHTQFLHPTLCAKSSTSPNITTPEIPMGPLATAMAGDLRPGTADLRPEATARRPASPYSPTEGKVRCGVWNMRGFVSNDHCRLREKVIIASDLDLLCVCETFLRGNDGINIPGYRWFGNNRLNISKRAVRGSGGVGILIKDSLFNKYSIDIVDKNYEDIIWVSCTQTKDPDQVLYICVCYLPPASSSWGRQVSWIL